MNAKRTVPGRHSSHQADQLALHELPLSPKRWRYVLTLLLREHNWRHSSKHKGVSHKTMAERQRFCHWLFDFLRRPPRQFKLDPRSFSGRHAEAVMAHWQSEAKAGRMSPATIQTYFSFLKTFTAWIGKPRLLRPIGCYFEDARLYQRSLASGIDKSWRAQGVDVEAVIRAVEAYDVHAAVSLKLMQAFHLRFKESVMLRPHEDVLTAAQAGRVGEQIAFYLDTHRGTKGGRERMIAIDTAQRQAAIDYARRVTVGVHESVSDPRLTLQQAMRHLRYVMERHGIARAALGVTPHGLRHQGAADGYEAITGQRPPVAGGGLVDPELDRRARQQLAEHLGHGRTQITDAYFGKTPRSVSSTAGDFDHATDCSRKLP
ncbi:integrase domain-containing protein [Thauera sp.]|uniref:integrase domain-containing protein n=1 Tax=Thauera sp. TaxID=1905334 RepID=UPI0039E37433